MITLLFSVIFLIAFLSAESLVSTIVGGVVALLGTQYFKAAVGVQGAGATVLAFVISFVVAIIAFAISTALSGGEIGWGLIPQGSLQIFALATLAYNLILKSNS